MASIRGHMGQIRIFENGVLQKIFDITKFDLNQDSSFSRSFYVGNPVGEGDQTVEGWSGSIDLEVKDDSVDKFIDALINNQLNGVGVSDYQVILTESYPNGTSASYVYFDGQFKMSRSQGGSTEKVTKRLDCQFSGRERL
jgi:hypothetical protein